MLKLVPTVQTNFSQYEFIKAMIVAWFNMYKTYPSKQSIGVVFSQWSLETGQGKYCWNNNIGNIKAKDIAGEVVEYCALKGVWEIVNGKRIELTKDDPGSWFRSFPTLSEGVVHHFEFLKNKRYKIAWAAVVAGDPKDFCHKLKVQGYYTAPESDYTRAVMGYYNQYMKSQIFEKALTEIQNANNTNNSNTDPVNVPDTGTNPVPPVVEPPQEPEVITLPEVVIEGTVNKTVKEKISDFFSKLFKK